MLGVIFLLIVCNIIDCTYKAVDELDVDKYVGDWYQVYQDRFNLIFQEKGTCSKAHYELLDDGRISVLNEQLDEDGTKDEITGYAYYKDDDCCGYLTVQLRDIPEASYWVLELGPVVDDYYDYSIVSDNKGLSLYVLARDVDRFFKLYNDDVINSLEDFGFNKFFNKPIIMEQQNCTTI